jgi:large subunit ribosomal protein L3
MKNEFEIGQVLNVDSFSPGQLVNIRGKSIGKGFSGLQKRHNFTRGPMTHGSKNHRAPGSIGMGTTPGRVLPGKKMAGQLGNKITTIKKLKSYSNKFRRKYFSNKRICSRKTWKFIKYCSFRIN